jgi:DNA (cytosine-5)-methyltransferase 1
VNSPWEIMDRLRTPYWLRSRISDLLVALKKWREVHPGRELVIDAFCCEGGASMGLFEAGFLPVGVDLDPVALKKYPFPFVMADAIAWLPLLIELLQPTAVVGSPPCQADSDAQVLQGREHPRLIAPFREIVVASELPYWIENVGGAVKKGNLQPDVRLCGLMFGLKTDRHRFFELSFPVEVPEHPVGPRGHEDHRDMPKTKMGREFADGELRQNIGNFHGPGVARLDLRTPWMSRRGMAECIPPDYGLHLGKHLKMHLDERKAA